MLNEKQSAIRIQNIKQILEVVAPNGPDYKNVQFNEKAASLEFSRNHYGSKFSNKDDKKAMQIFDNFGVSWKATNGYTDRKISVSINQEGFEENFSRLFDSCKNAMVVRFSERYGANKTFSQLEKEGAIFIDVEGKSLNPILIREAIRREVAELEAKGAALGVKGLQR